MEQADKKAGLSSAHTRDVPPFIQVLYDVMMDPGLESVVKWNHPQPGFVVVDQPKFVAHVLPRLCQTKSFDSFVRQLQCYGFSKQRGGSKLVFHHTENLFRKSEPALLRSIKRAKKKPPSTSSRVTNASSTIGGSVVDADNAAALSQLTLRARKAPPPLLPALSPSTSPVHVKEDIVAMPAPALPSSRPDDAGSCFSSAKEELHTKRHHARSASSSVMDASECSSEETSSSSVGGGAGGGRVRYDYLPTNPSRRRHKRQGHNTDHAPKVKRRLEVYESFITDALSTMQELLSHAKISQSQTDEAMATTLSRFVGRAAPLFSQLRVATPASCDELASCSDGASGDVSMDAVSQQLSVLMSAINVSKRPAAPVPPAATPPAPFVGLVTPVAVPAAPQPASPRLPPSQSPARNKPTKRREVAPAVAAVLLGSEGSSDTSLSRGDLDQCLLSLGLCDDSDRLTPLLLKCTFGPDHGSGGQSRSFVSSPPPETPMPAVATPFPFARSSDTKSDVVPSQGSLPDFHDSAVESSV